MAKEDRVELIPITKEHTSLIVKWRNDKKVRANFIFQEDFTEEMHNNWLENEVASGKVAQFIIMVKENKKPIGSVYFRDIDYDKKQAEYGIFIGEDDERGKGYGNEAAELALKYAFNELKLKEVILRVFSDNIAAIKSYEKAGFKVDRVEKDFMDGRDLVFMKVERK